MTAAVPTHDRFERPALAWYLLFHPGLASLAAMSASQPLHDAVAARVPVPLPSRSLMRSFLIGTFFVHIGESVLAYRTAKAAGMDRSASRWARETMIVGFPSILRLQKIAAEG